MKKIAKIITSFLIIFTIVILPVYANNEMKESIQDKSNIEKQTTTQELLEMKQKEEKSLQEYKDSYGSDAYGLTAYLLNKIRILSIPFAFAIIAIAAVYQYMLGIRKLDVRDKGFKLMIASVSVLIICQILPLIFAITVKGWRG